MWGKKPLRLKELRNSYDQAVGNGPHLLDPLKIILSIDV